MSLCSCIFNDTKNYCSLITRNFVYFCTAAYRRKVSLRANCVKTETLSHVCFPAGQCFWSDTPPHISSVRHEMLLSWSPHVNSNLTGFLFDLITPCRAGHRLNFNTSSQLFGSNHACLHPLVAIGLYARPSQICTRIIGWRKKKGEQPTGVKDNDNGMPPGAIVLQAGKKKYFSASMLLFSSPSCTLKHMNARPST